ncbi:MAG: ATP synthase F0 subunit B [Bdellovibrionota bacterium]
MHSLISPTINLVILLSVMVYYLRQPLRGYVSGRHSSLKDELERVRELLKKAKAQFEEFSAKIGSMDSEIRAMKDQAKEDASQIRTKIAAEADRAAKNALADAKAGAESLYADLKGRLYLELSQKVLERAEKLLHERLTGDDRARIRKEFSKEVESMQ